MMKTIWSALIRFGFRLLYYELAWSYDLVSWLVSLGQWRQWQRAAIPFITGSRVLELGHGPGHMLRELAQSDRTLIGVDLSPYMGRQAQRRLRREQLPVRLVQGRVQFLPFASGSIDTVLSTFPTEYIVDPETLRAVKRVLRANGRFIIVPSASLHNRGLLTNFINWLYRVTGQRQDAFDLDAPNATQQATWQQLSHRFAAAGLHVDLHHVNLPHSTVTIMVAKPN